MYFYRKADGICYRVTNEIREKLIVTEFFKLLAISTRGFIQVFLEFERIKYFRI